MFHRKPFSDFFVFLQVLKRNHVFSNKLTHELTRLDSQETRSRRYFDQASAILYSEHTLITKQKTKPLKDVRIPQWRAEDTCTCQNEPFTCPLHWRTHELQRQREERDKRMMHALNKDEDYEKVYESYHITRSAKPKRRTLAMAPSNAPLYIH